jgi:hypothetical protein
LTSCENCGKVKSKSSFYDAKERIGEYALSWPPHDHDEHEET